MSAGMIAAPPVQTAYNPDRQTAAYRAAVAGADNANVGGATFLTAVAALSMAGRQNVPISARGTVAGATIGVRIAYFWVDPTTGTRYLLGISPELILTASATLKDVANTLFLADNVVFDSFAANEVRVFCSTAPSSGTFDLWVGGY